MGGIVKRNSPGRGQEALEQVPKLLHQALHASFFWVGGGDSFNMNDGEIDDGDGGDGKDEGNMGDGGDVDDGDGDGGDGGDRDDGGDGDGDKNNLSLLPLVQGALQQLLPPVAKHINSSFHV